MILIFEFWTFTLLLSLYQLTLWMFIKSSFLIDHVAISFENKYISSYPLFFPPVHQTLYFIQVLELEMVQIVQSLA